MFTVDSYGSHTVCISEAEKYEKSLYKGKPQKQNPQDAWMQVITKAAASSDTAPQSISGFLCRLGELDNVPRNKNKFTNFVKNSLKLHNLVVIESIWQFLEKLKVGDEGSTRREDTTKEELHSPPSPPSPKTSGNISQHSASCQLPSKKRKEYESSHDGNPGGDERAKSTPTMNKTEDCNEESEGDLRKVKKAKKDKKMKKEKKEKRDKEKKKKNKKNSN
jgi:LYAR-type C2HC zinc finger